MIRRLKRRAKKNVKRPIARATMRLRRGIAESRDAWWMWHWRRARRG